MVRYLFIHISNPLRTLILDHFSLALRVVNQASHKTDIPPGESRYPHEFINAEGFSFPACEGGTIIEYPVLRTVHNPWIPGSKNTKLNSKANPDRVIFTVKSASEGTYCGTITHNYNMKNPKNGKPGAIEPCVEKS